MGVIGGNVHGGRVYNSFPSSLLEESEQDLGRGRLIPKYPWENMMVPIAEWMGVTESQHSMVFPNLANFDRSAHILAKDTLFQARVALDVQRACLHRVYCCSSPR